MDPRDRQLEEIKSDIFRQWGEKKTAIVTIEGKEAAFPRKFTERYIREATWTHLKCVAVY